MWLEICNFLHSFIAVFLTAFAVKIIDDYLDQDMDNGIQKNWALLLGPGCVIYAILLLAIGFTLNTPLCFALFLSCYTVGMYNNMFTVLPLHMKGWQESLIVLFIGIMVTNLTIIVFSICLVTATQLLDDCIDYHVDMALGSGNLASKWGTLECLICALILILIASQMNHQVFWPTVTAIGACYLLNYKWQNSGGMSFWE